LGPSVAAGLGSLLKLNTETIYQSIQQALHTTISTRQSRKGQISSWKAFAPSHAGKLAIEAVDRAMRGEGSPSPIYEGEDSVIAYVLSGPKAKYTVPLPKINEEKKAILETYTKEHSAEYQAQAWIDLARNLNKKINNKKIKFPIVIKPINEGSSLGVSICKNKKQFISKYKKLMRNYDRILVEEYIPGREIQVAVMGERALGAIELVPRRQFYDYTAKYSNTARTRHIMPAPLSPKKYKEILGLAKKAHKLLGCRGITRSDFRFFKNKFYLLETNTQPGMTKLSLVPEIAQYCGIKFEDLVVWMTENASSNK